MTVPPLDIVERLRETAQDPGLLNVPLCIEAADKIERLRKALTEIETIAANDRGDSMGAIIAVCQMENRNV